MKVLLIKIFRFSLPCIGLILLAEVLHRFVPHEFSERKKLINSQKFNGYILGSSHTYFGLNPEKITAAKFLNLGWPSQDFKTDINIYEKLLRQRKFDYLVLDCSVFMFPYRRELEEKAVNKESYNIYYFDAFKSHILSFTFRSVTERISKYFLNTVIRKRPFLRMNDEGFSYRQSKVEINEKAPEDGKRHNNYWNNSDMLKENIIMLSKLINENKNKEIIFYLPPLHPLYRSYISKRNWNIYFDIIKKFSAYNNVLVINFITILDKHLESFQDGDHLLPASADSVSSIFNKALLNFNIKK